MSYIEREAVLLHLNEIWLSAMSTDTMYDDDRQLAMVRCMGLNDAMDAVKEAPAADVRPVVCCKDCVYAYPYGLEIKCTKHSGKADRLGEDATYSEFYSENWYCADAQRKREKRGEV